MLNRTHLEHTIIALLIQAALAVWLGWWSAGAVAVALLFGREYAQVEYKVRARTGRGLTAMMPWHVLRPSLWSRDAVLDWVLPALACALLAWILSS